MKQIIAIGIILALVLSGCAQFPLNTKPALEVEIGKSFSLVQNQTAIIKKNGAEIGRITLTELKQSSQEGTCLESLQQKCTAIASISSTGFDNQPITFSLNSTENNKKEIGNYLIEFYFYTWDLTPLTEIKNSIEGPMGVFIVTEKLIDSNGSDIPFPPLDDSGNDEPPEVPF